MTRVLTRAKALGVKPRGLETKTRRMIGRIRTQLEGLSYLWMDIDGGMEDDFQVLADKLAEIDGDGGSLSEAIERLNAPDEADYEASL